MNVVFEYHVDPNIPVNTVSVIGSMNDFSEEKGRMERVGDSFRLEMTLPSGDHFYSFLINGNLRLNDPSANIYAPDKEDKIWSVVIIDKDGQRLYNNTQYNVHIDDYKLSTVVTKEETIVHKRKFNRFTEKQAVARFTFKNITGLHAVTAAWYNPMGDLFEVSESAVLEDPNDPTFTWFWIDLKNPKKPVFSGLWTLKLFVDGSFILEDKFNIMEDVSYSR